MGKYFGTDGFRGEANVTLRVEHAYKVGRYLGYFFGKQHDDGKAHIAIGKDTRLSSYMFEYALAAGLAASGANAYLLHVTTTPSVAYVTRVDGLDCGIMISASHNPFHDNGIKLINKDGEKIDDKLIDEIEEYIDSKEDTLELAVGDKIGATVDYVNARNRYVGYLMGLAKFSFRGYKVGIDAANGSAWSIAKSLFETLGAEVFLIHAEPNGLNINKDCGSTHVDALMRFVTANGCDCGIAFDGAAERCLAVDETGALADGDVIIAACAKDMKEQGRLSHNTIIFTQANNLGLLQFARTNGIGTSASSTGERSMIRRMLECGYSLGGDPAGHILFPDDSTSADGQLTGLRLLEVLKRSGSKMSGLSSLIEKCPQVMLNVPIDKRFREVWKNDRAITGIIDEFEQILGEDGRVVVREAGKDPVIRIRIEGRDFSTINTMALQIADTIKERLDLYKPH